jgi:hypothetical protein
MNERDRLALRQHRAEIEAEEAAEREARERPIREATEQAQELHRRIYNTIRERLLTMADVDELGGSLAYIAPDLCNISWPMEVAVEFNVVEFRKFADANGWFYNTPGNHAAIFRYFELNGIQIGNALMVEKAARRLAEFNLLPEEPPVDVPRSQQPYVNLEIDRSQEPPAPVTHSGFDPATGEPRIYSEYEVRRMSSDEYVRAFRLGRVFSSGVPLRNVVRK